MSRIFAIGAWLVVVLFLGLVLGGVARADLVRVPTSAGATIQVAAHLASKFQGFIADVQEKGFHGSIRCYARSGHVRHSLHYSGSACDFAQTGRGRTHAVMYHVGDLARKWGLRDGCTFRDCGHIDSGRTKHRKVRRG